MCECPNCHSESRVTDSRKSGAGIKRKRCCQKCGNTWHTYECSIGDVTDKLVSFRVSMVQLAEAFATLAKRQKLLEQELVEVGDKLVLEFAAKETEPDFFKRNGQWP